MTIKAIIFTPIELGAMTLVLQDFKKAKSKKEHNKLYSNLYSFIKSMGNIKDSWYIANSFEILSIDEMVSFNVYPCEVYYEVRCEFQS